MQDQWIRKRAIIKLLSSGQFVSGEELATELSISRAAIGKHIGGLEEYGVDIFSVKGKGYKLATPISMIDEKALLERSQGRCFYFDEVASTNGFLLKHVEELSSGDLCVAEYQSAGRGRRGRTWVSPYGGHLYFSLFWRFPQGMAQAMGLSLVVACSLSKVLEQFGVAGVGVKWPNDIYLDHKKLAGVLVEMSGQADSECNLVIGIGINLAMSPAQAQQIDQPWSDLSQQTDLPNKTELALALHAQLIKDLKLFEQSGLGAFLPRWQQADIFENQQVKLSMGDKSISGICRGIDEQGALLLESEGEVRAYVGGEISLRAN
ncbi:bifunctional biotin--[acetyl-CoA-carboxylase] ligase/biotin operon repressor BirA [Shewanella sp. Scap07]|uniref:bifunctional biotin--[acetyl-CoA-carboxylase] ligase/biotin operon repressor BirA n=1 Tax=Shewanella sp. Scap07 TaxID=2589987 RepID=UPI0015B845A6|nr:bifunctional biotin--[acetyl-CoA-carboxylase] ligase/biotin operon repressor BirA [Shewanella sp. Scap07]QLE83838.1 bifunctional biotin--[acetyl-CoA-carboxylase] ligase/biotin operon repressor BirA [Shewanella sp. Scap07]